MKTFEQILKFTNIESRISLMSDFSLHFSCEKKTNYVIGQRHISYMGKSWKSLRFQKFAYRKSQEFLTIFLHRVWLNHVIIFGVLNFTSVYLTFSSQDFQKVFLNKKHQLGPCFFTPLHNQRRSQALQTSKVESSSVIRQKGKSQNGCFKKTKHVKFSEKIDVLCFLETPVMRFALLPYH